MKRRLALLALSALMLAGCSSGQTLSAEEAYGWLDRSAAVACLSPSPSSVYLDDFDGADGPDYVAIFQPGVNQPGFMLTGLHGQEGWSLRLDDATGLEGAELKPLRFADGGLGLEYAKTDASVFYRLNSGTSREADGAAHVYLSENTPLTQPDQLFDAMVESEDPALLMEMLITHLSSSSQDASRRDENGETLLVLEGFLTDGNLTCWSWTEGPGAEVSTDQITFLPVVVGFTILNNRVSIHMERLLSPGGRYNDRLGWYLSQR